MSTLASLLLRDRVIVGTGLAAIVVLAWLYLIRLAGDMGEMAEHAAMGMAMPQAPPGMSSTSCSCSSCGR